MREARISTTVRKGYNNLDGREEWIIKVKKSKKVGGERRNAPREQQLR